VSAQFLLPKNVDTMEIRLADWIRLPLFDAQRGDIGLAWSIFKIRGTPDEVNWPDFDRLPHATGVEFRKVPSVDLKSHLPNLPSDVPSTGSGHEASSIITASPLDLIHRLLMYPPHRRFKAADSLRHPWFQTDSHGDLLLPSEHPGTKEAPAQHRWNTVWNENELGHWLSMFLQEKL